MSPAGNSNGEPTVYLQFRITAVDGSDKSCVVNVIDNPWYRIDKENDHWEMVSGSLPGLSARRGTFARFATKLNLHGLARLNVPTPVSVGATGDGDSNASYDVSWELL